MNVIVIVSPCFCSGHALWDASFRRLATGCILHYWKLF